MSSNLIIFWHLNHNELWYVENKIFDADKIGFHDKLWFSGPITMVELRESYCILGFHNSFVTFYPSKINGSLRQGYL
jgi:hypothetical protein